MTTLADNQFPADRNYAAVRFPVPGARALPRRFVVAQANPPIGPFLFFLGVAVSFLFTSVSKPAFADSSRVLEVRGETMGTTYSVKVFDPPEWDDEFRFEIEAELRSVNDQMSTYLKSSEISRFNRSESTDWFDVSAETATVVEAAQRISRATDGAFDVTVLPLVNAWNFGPEPRSRRPPVDSSVEATRKLVGYERLHVRTDPPALRKDDPTLQVDLSAIAKGHGVDRVVELLTRAGAVNLFVEIGGEVRATGDKAGVPWRIGIQRPDAVSNAILVPYPLVDRAVATSGDYRNRFEAEGTEYSHTIDPRTGRPATHRIASVTVTAADCMRADGWATAIGVLGREAGLAAARAEGLDVLVISRDDDRGFVVEGAGELADITDEAEEALASIPRGEGNGRVVGAGKGEDANENFLAQLMPVMLVTLVAFGIVLAVMAVGVLFGRRSISGSCGGLSAGAGGNPENCSMCGNATEGCRELQDRMAEASQGSGPFDMGNDRYNRGG